MAHLQRHNKKKVDDVVEVGADGSLAGRRRRARGARRKAEAEEEEEAAPAAPAPANKGYT